MYQWCLYNFGSILYAKIVSAMSIQLRVPLQGFGKLLDLILTLGPYRLESQLLRWILVFQLIRFRYLYFLMGWGNAYLQKNFTHFVTYYILPKTLPDFIELIEHSCFFRCDERLCLCPKLFGQKEHWKMFDSSWSQMTCSRRSTTLSNNFRHWSQCSVDTFFARGVELFSSTSNWCSLFMCDEYSSIDKKLTWHE